MEARFLLDSNICIYIRLNISPNRGCGACQTLGHGQAGLSVITFWRIGLGSGEGSASLVGLK